MAKHAGNIMPRNGCRAPWQNRLDLRLSQTLRVSDAEIRLQGDLINVLNLFNSDWGKLESIGPVVPVMEGCIDCGANGKPVVSWGSSVLTSRDQDGRLQAADPWNVLSPDSQWQAQFGIQVTFGREH